MDSLWKNGSHPQCDKLYLVGFFKQAVCKHMSAVVYIHAAETGVSFHRHTIGCRFCLTACDL